MTSLHPSRRAVLAGLGATTALSMTAGRARAAGEVIAAIYPGTWDESFREIVAPALDADHGVELVLDPLFAVDQIAKARAARGLAPFDVFVLDPGPAATGAEMDLFAPLDLKQLSNGGTLPAQFVDATGVPVAAQAVGIAYNPTKVAKPTGWAQLFEPEFASRLGLTGFQTTFGTSSLIEISKVFGGSMTDIDPAMEKIREVLPMVPAVAQPAAMPGLFQQGQIDIMYTNTQTVARLKSLGVDIEFATPETGAIAFVTTMHIVKDAENVDNAYKYIDTVISAPVQSALMSKYDFVPVNDQVELLDSLPMASLAELDNFVRHDWTQINPLRAQWIERFNREVAV
jgi:putative spermidine/putrescine transport system substrate-binding protein